MTNLLAELAEAEAANNQRIAVNRVGCAMCNALAKMEDPVKEAVEAALTGTIGRDKLVTILRSHGYDVGRRSLERHRQEGHS